MSLSLIMYQREIYLEQDSKYFYVGTKNLSQVTDQNKIDSIKQIQKDMEHFNYSFNRVFDTVISYYQSDFEAQLKTFQAYKNFDNNRAIKIRVEANNIKEKIRLLEKSKEYIKKLYPELFA